MEYLNKGRSRIIDHSDIRSSSTLISGETHFFAELLEQARGQVVQLHPLTRHNFIGIHVLQERGKLFEV